MLSAGEMASRWVSALRLCRRGLLRSRSTDMACLLETLACTKPGRLSDASAPYETIFREPPDPAPTLAQAVCNWRVEICTWACTSLPNKDHLSIYSE